MSSLPRPLATPRKSLLTIAKDGPQTGPAQQPIWLILHDRNGALQTARELGQRLLPETSLRIAVRSARTQTRGSIAPPMGHFWFIGPGEKPELMTLCDGLSQLDRLVDDLTRDYGPRPLHLIGEGEGGVMALLLGLLRPERVAEVMMLHAPCPASLKRIPFEPGAKPWPQVWVCNDDPAQRAENALRLAEFGIEFTCGSDAFSTLNAARSPAAALSEKLHVQADLSNVEFRATFGG